MGISDEEAIKGKVLPICFQEIDNCHPFFICLLGERYGTILDEFPDEVIEHMNGYKSSKEHA